jgi:hypothetical protein
MALVLSRTSKLVASDVIVGSINSPTPFLFSSFQIANAVRYIGVVHLQLSLSSSILTKVNNFKDSDDNECPDCNKESPSATKPNASRDGFGQSSSSPA